MSQAFIPDQIVKRGVEHDLLDFIDRVESKDRTALHLYLSRLQAGNKRRHYIQAAIKLFEFYTQRFEGRLFILSNYDLIFVAKNVDEAALQKSIEELANLFNKDPIVRFSQLDNKKTRFASWFELEQEYEAFVAAVQKTVKDIELQKGVLTKHSSSANDGVFEQDYDFLDRKVAGLAQFVDLLPLLSRVNIGDFVRDQACCVMAGDSAREVFYEKYVSIHDIQRTFMPEFSLHESRALFNYLTQFLDEKMLDHLNDDMQSYERAFSINMNTTTLLSDHFQEFESKIPTKVRGKIIIEMQVNDLLHDLSGFLFAKDFVRDLGFNVLLDGLDQNSLMLLDMKRINVDLCKLKWNMDWATYGLSDERAAVKEKVQNSNVREFILSHCDSPQAIEAGKELGISMYQGLYIDSTLQNARRAQENKIYRD